LNPAQRDFVFLYHNVQYPPDIKYLKRAKSRAEKEVSYFRTGSFWLFCTWRSE